MTVAPISRRAVSTSPIRSRDGPGCATSTTTFPGWMLTRGPCKMPSTS